ncbi:S-adenosyl methyltransferase [Micromonospora pisi]|uniref:S-adenosyl methyltransferase n=1 Tax=Micromonospora pisi TaxID=589240 RepID=A0A495JBQ7_9ACTN|nr:SAM-dependent methyltransferase [Micromonospora pisi]RKR86161.1 S-adenosyl methyltransferase [Micromonospora pisi]
MTESPRPSVPASRIDPSVSHSARIWNYWLGGKDNFQVDRQIGDQFQELFPDIVPIARGSREFLSRAVTYLAREVGIRQFLDIGTGLPTVENTHEVAQRVAPECRIVYVDNDPMVLSHARALLAGTPQGVTEYVDADLRDTDRILESARRATLDLDQPVGLMLMNILGHVPDVDEARSIVARLMGGLPSGSHLVVADGTNVVDGDAFEAAIGVWNASGSQSYHLRTPDEIGGYFDGLELVEPGVVSCPLWRPDPADPRPRRAVDEFGAVGRKP